MSIEGHIEIVVRRAQGRVAGAEVRSRRPQIAARLLVGRTPAEAVARVPLVFSVCARAQQAAARAACAAAAGVTSGSPDGDALRVLAESAHESFWRILGDWPELVGEGKDTTALATMRRALLPLVRGETTVTGDAVAACAALLADTVLGTAADGWLAGVAAGEAAAWWQRRATAAARLLASVPESFAGDAPAGRPACHGLPALAAADFAAALTAALADPAFAQLPRWQGMPAETGPLPALLPRLAVADGGCGPRVRLLARLVDCALRVARLHAAGPAARIDAARGPDGRGWAVVETARGMLMHVVQLDGERIADYRIIAPTEWNFHPQGPLPQLLVGAVANSAAAVERFAALAVQALDPCVAHRVEIVDA